MPAAPRAGAGARDDTRSSTGPARRGTSQALHARAKRSRRAAPERRQCEGGQDRQGPARSHHPRLDCEPARPRASQDAARSDRGRRPPEGDTTRASKGAGRADPRDGELSSAPRSPPGPWEDHAGGSRHGRPRVHARAGRAHAERGPGRRGRTRNAAPGRASAGAGRPRLRRLRGRASGARWKQPTLDQVGQARRGSAEGRRAGPGRSAPGAAASRADPAAPEGRGRCTSQAHRGRRENPSRQGSTRDVAEGRPAGERGAQGKHPRLPSGGRRRHASAASSRRCRQAASASRIGTESLKPPTSGVNGRNDPVISAVPSALALPAGGE
jgi:hypothetical protein